MRAELEMAEKKIKMKKAAKAASAKLPELKITPFKGTPVDWIRFQNMLTSQYTTNHYPMKRNMDIFWSWWPLR